MADRCIHQLLVGGSYGQPAEVWSDLERRLTPKLSERGLVGQVLGGGPAS
jgi:hypothetical protein